MRVFKTIVLASIVALAGLILIITGLEKPKRKNKDKLAKPETDEHDGYLIEKYDVWCPYDKGTAAASRWHKNELPEILSDLEINEEPEPNEQTDDESKTN